MSSTSENLQEAFAGESQANQKYGAFAKAAEKEGLVNIAKLFKTTAEAERIHAEGHLKAMEKVGTTVENLQGAIDGETYEFTTMYPPMVEQAQADGHKAKTMFTFAVKAEAVHAMLYKKAIEAAKAGKDLDVSDFYLCPVCGHIELGNPPEKCPVCGAKQSAYITVA